MGGNIWDTSLRLDKKDYLILEEKIVNMLLEEIVTDKAHLSKIKFIKDKETFGDLDLLVTKEYKHKEYLLQYLQNKKYPYQVNTDVVSFLFENFQVDIIFVKNFSELSYAKHYFSWNDAGNLVGRLIKQLGFKHGHQCLLYIDRRDTQVLAEIPLTYNYYKVLDILKLDVQTFLKGFKSKLELFSWITASPYFNAEIFKLENLNNSNRVRDRKRATYKEFLIYLEENKPNSFTYKFNRESIVLYNFPEFWGVLQENEKNFQENLAIKKAFNGVVIKDILNITGLPLGLFIKYLKSNISTETLLTFATIKTEAEQIELIKTTYQTYLQSNS